MRQKKTYIHILNSYDGEEENAKAKMPDEIMAESYQSEFITTAPNEGSFREFSRFFAIVYQSNYRVRVGEALGNELKILRYPPEIRMRLILLERIPEVNPVSQ